MASWLDLLSQETDEAETPRSYIYWAGLSAISAVISPNTFLNRGGVYQLRPNLYVLLVGHSGLGKGLPVAIAKKLVTLVQSTRVISGRNSIQAIVKILSEGFTSERKMETFTDARGFLVSGEFATLLLEDPHALTILTDLYDAHYNENWKNTLKGSGVEELERPTLTLLGGTSPEHFMAAVPQVNIFGGFIGRTLMVYEQKRHRVNPLSDENEKKEIDFEGLAMHLHQLSNLKGPFKWTNPARRFWEEWYVPFRNGDYADKTGLVHRMPDHCLKVAMCIAVSKKAELVIEEEDIREAIEACLLLGINTKRVVQGIGDSPFAKSTVLAMRTIYQAPDREMTKRRLLMLNYGSFDTYDLDRIIKTLEDGGMVTVRTDQRDTWYKLTQAALDEIEKVLIEQQTIH